MSSQKKGFRKRKQSGEPKTQLESKVTIKGNSFLGKVKGFLSKYRLCWNLLPLEKFFPNLCGQEGKRQHSPSRGRGWGHRKDRHEGLGSATLKYLTAEFGSYNPRAGAICVCFLNPQRFMAAGKSTQRNCCIWPSATPCLLSCNNHTYAGSGEHPQKPESGGTEMMTMVFVPLMSLPAPLVIFMIISLKGLLQRFSMWV